MPVCSSGPCLSVYRHTYGRMMWKRRDEIVLGAVAIFICFFFYSCLFLSLYIFCPYFFALCHCAIAIVVVDTAVDHRHAANFSFQIIFFFCFFIFLFDFSYRDSEIFGCWAFFWHLHNKIEAYTQVSSQHIKVTITVFLMPTNKTMIPKINFQKKKKYRYLVFAAYSYRSKQKKNIIFYIKCSRATMILFSLSLYWVTIHLIAPSCMSHIHSIFFIIEYWRHFNHVDINISLIFSTNFKVYWNIWL